MKGQADIVYFHEYEITSLREVVGEKAFLKSDVIKQAVGLRARYGLDLETLVLKFTNQNAYVSLSYQGRPDDDTEYEINGVVTQIFSDRPIHLQDVHPITYHAFEVVDAGVKANPLIMEKPDLMFQLTSKQLLEYLELMCLENTKDIEQIILSDESRQLEQDTEEVNISTKNFRISSIYSIDLISQPVQEELTRDAKKEILSAQVGFYGEKRNQYSKFLNYVVPFLSPTEQIKNALLKSPQALKMLEISSKHLSKEVLLPDTIIFNENNFYRVLLFHHIEQNNLKDPWESTNRRIAVTPLGRLEVVVLIEDGSSNMGIAALQSYLNRRNWNLVNISKDYNLDVALERKEIVSEKMKKNPETGIEEPSGSFEIDLQEIELYEGGAI
ncbi:MAG: hypothetical protein ACFFBD_01410 [Candidatus Hodarchaeota archaeon]